MPFAKFELDGTRRRFRLFTSDDSRSKRVSIAVGMGRGAAVMMMMGHGLRLITCSPRSAGTDSEAGIPFSSLNKSKAGAVNLLPGKPQAL